MIKEILISILLVTFLNGCSSFSRQLIKTGELSLNGGVFQNSKWQDSLNFKRISWFHEFTLFYDINISQLTKDSPFVNWLSLDEKKEFLKCEDFIIVVAYSLDYDKISHNMFYSEMEKNSFHKIKLPNFRRHFRSHPDSEKLYLSLYELNGFCRNGESSQEEKYTISEDKVFISFPGFSEQQINYK